MRREIPLHNKKVPYDSCLYTFHFGFEIPMRRLMSFPLVNYDIYDMETSHIFIDKYMSFTYDNIMILIKSYIYTYIFIHNMKTIHVSDNFPHK